MTQLEVNTDWEYSITVVQLFYMRSLQYRKIQMYVGSSADIFPCIGSALPNLCPLFSYKFSVSFLLYHHKNTWMREGRTYAGEEQSNREDIYEYKLTLL